VDAGPALGSSAVSEGTGPAADSPPAVFADPLPLSAAGGLSPAWPDAEDCVGAGWPEALEL